MKYCLHYTVYILKIKTFVKEFQLPIFFVFVRVLDQAQVLLRNEGVVNVSGLKVNIFKAFRHRAQPCIYTALSNTLVIFLPMNAIFTLLPGREEHNWEREVHSALLLPQIVAIHDVGGAASADDASMLQ